MKIAFISYLGTTVVGYYDNQSFPHPTIRHVQCELITEGHPTGCCLQCQEYRLHWFSRDVYRGGAHWDSPPPPEISKKNYLIHLSFCMSNFGDYILVRWKKWLQHYSMYSSGVLIFSCCWYYKMHCLQH